MPASPFQASGETSPGKNDDLPRTIAGSTPLPLGRRSFAVSGPLAPVRSASYPVPVRRLTGSFHASFSVRLTTNALRFPSVPATRFREDFHLQVIAHAGPTTMAAPKRLSPAQIINRLRKAEVALANGNTTKEVCRELGVSEQTYYRWRREYGGMKLSQAKRLKEFEKENQQLKRAVAELTLDKLILKEASEGNF